MLTASLAALAGPGGGSAVYVIGNLEGILPGAEGILVLEEDQAVFRSGKVVLPVPYGDIRNVELGTKVLPPSGVPIYKIWQLHKRFPAQRPLHQMVNFEFIDKDRKDHSMTLEFEEAAANETLVEIETRTGKRKRATNADPWWGDSAWKTTRNSNSVSPDMLGKSPTK